MRKNARPSRTCPHSILAIVGAIGIAVSSCAPVEFRLAEPIRPDEPLSLDEAVGLAIRNNPDIFAAEERVTAARAAIDEAHSYYWPVLAIVERFTQTDTPSQAFASILDQRRFSNTLDFNDPGVTPNFRTGLTGSITLFDGGRRRARALAAQASALSAEARAEIVRRDIALEVARAFFLFHEADGVRRAQERSLETLATHLRIVEARLEQGAARRSDALAIEVRRAETREAVIGARNAAERARAGLAILLGLGVLEELELERPPADDPEEVAELPELLERAREGRFELVEAIGTVRAAQARVKEMWAGYFPDVTLFGSFGFDDNELTAANANWTWGIGIAEDIFDALRTPARVEQAVATLRSAHAELRRVALEVELDVKSAVLDAEAADARFAVASQAVALAEESHRLVQIELEEGAATIDRLLDAEVALTQARIRLDTASFDRQLARIAIAHAVGEYPAPPPDETGAAIEADAEAERETEAGDEVASDNGNEIRDRNANERE